MIWGKKQKKMDNRMVNGNIIVKQVNFKKIETYENGEINKSREIQIKETRYI